MSNTVQFTINLNGNAVSGVATLTDKVNELSRATGKAQGAFAGLGKIGGKLMVFNQAFELIGKVVSKSREFVEANNAQQEAEAKLGQVMRNTMGATVEQIDSIKARALFLYTDGLNEAENSQQEQFGDDRLLELLRNTRFDTARQVVETLSVAVGQHRNGAEPNDDLTMMCIRTQ